MIRRTFDPAFLNEVANHPDVRPWLMGEGRLDLAPIIGNPANYALVTDGGGFVLHCHEPGIYEVHSQFLPAARRGSIEAMRDGFRFMFERTDAFRIVTKVPRDNPRAAAFAKLAGFRFSFERAGIDHLTLDIDDWCLARPEHGEDGHRFHEWLEAEKLSRESVLPTHDDDGAHDHMVGACWRIARHRPAKAVAVYNRWARLAGYAPMFLISESPAAVDFHDAVVGLSPDGELEMQLCR